MGWTQIVFGWPSALGGAVLLVLGVVYRRAWLSLVGALLSLGFCAYVGLNPPPFRIVGPAVFAANVLSAVALRGRARWVAAALLLPYAGLLLYLARAVAGAW